MKHLQSSTTPLQDLALVGAHQDPIRRGYRHGYEKFFDLMPVITGNENEHPSLEAKFSKTIMEMVADQVIADNWLTEKDQRDGEFARTIIGMEKPRIVNDTLQEGAEFVIAHWGTGFTSPVHGHSPGYLHEAVLKGRVKVNTFRMVDPNSDKAILLGTDIVEKGTFVSQYAQALKYKYKRSVLIHNFVALEPTHTLHYLPEHTRDGKDNRFYPEYFENVYNLSPSDLKLITPQEALYSKVGTVILVRSDGVPEFGDHYIVITGSPVMKKNGLRPMERAIDAPGAKDVIAHWNTDYKGVTLLQLDEHATEAFHEYHGIKVLGTGGAILFPSLLPLTL